MANPTHNERLKPFPEVSQALRDRIDQIVKTWLDEVRQAIPTVANLSDVELQDNISNILVGLADALSTANGTWKKLTRESPSQGIRRFHQQYNIRELMHEDRLLRAVIFEQVEPHLGRRTTLGEQIAMDMGIDLMLQQSVTAYVDEQNARIRLNAENELKYLSFLSHDLNNNLGSVTLFLQVLRQRLADFPEFAQDVATLDQTQESILNTIGGMGRLLQAERLRKSGVVAKAAPVNLRRLSSNIVHQMSKQAEKKGLRLEVDIPSAAVVTSDGELITLVLQNLLGNSIKYSTSGVVSISAAHPENDGQWTLTVADEGPGIAKEHLDRIFEAFKRGEAHGQTGVGLGLAIASQAARLLGAELTLESTVRVGTKFRLTLPTKAGASKA